MATGSTPIIYGDDGNDTLTVKSTSDAHVEGGTGHDTLIGGAGNDYLIGGQGDDEIIGGAGNDSIYGDDGVQADPTGGNDVIYGGSGNDWISGGAGNDFIDVGTTTQDDVAWGDAGDDYLKGDSGLNAGESLYGGDGDDIILPTPATGGGNYASGGNGNDYIDVLDLEPDFYNAGSDIKLPLSDACSVNVDPSNLSAFSVKCKLPWLHLPASLDGLFDVNVGVDSSGNPVVDGDVAGGMESISVTDWHQLLAANGQGLDGEVVAYDPQIPGFPPGWSDHEL